jgi:hypothetical protein
MAILTCYSSCWILLLLVQLCVASEQVTHSRRHVQSSFGFTSAAATCFHVVPSSTRACSRRKRQTSVSVINTIGSSPSLIPLSSTEEEFEAWLRTEIDCIPNQKDHAIVFDNAVGAIVQWRRRYRGNPAVWQRLFKAKNVVKELSEAAPIIEAVAQLIHDHDGPDKVTIVDLASGKGYLSMFLSELLPPEKVNKLILVDKAWPMCGSTPQPHHMNWDHIYGNALKHQAPISTRGPSRFTHPNKISSQRAICDP